MTRRKDPGERKRPGPKPGARAAAKAVASAAITAAAAAPPPAAAPAAQEQQTRFPDPLQRHRNIDTMPEAELRAYALQLGMTPRDARDLSVERLRVNARAYVHDLIEDL